MSTYGTQLDVYGALGEPAPLPVRAPSPLELLAAAWLASYGSEHTRRAYRRDLDAWLAFCSEIGVHPFEARRVHVDAWSRAGAGYTKTPAASSLARRLAAVSAFYAYAVQEDLADRNPAVHVRRPAIDRDDSPTRGLDKDEAKVMLIAARESMPARDRVAIQLMLLHGLRVSGVTGLDVEDLGFERGHRTVTYTAKGGKRRTRALAPATAEALELLLEGRTTGPLLASSTGRRLASSALYRTVQRCAVLAGITEPETVTPHSLRHTFITLALDDGVPLHVVQDAAGHADPRQTQGYNRRRRRLDQDPSYRLGALLAD